MSGQSGSSYNKRQGVGVAPYEKSEKMAQKYRRLTAPARWANYLIHCDRMNLDERDRLAADAWIARNRFGWPVAAEQAGFTRVHDAFAESPVATQCCRYLFPRRE